MILKNIKGKKFKRIDIESGTDFYFCCSSFLNNKKIINFLKKDNEDFKDSFWEKITIDNLEIFRTTNVIQEQVIRAGHTNIENKDYIFFLEGDEDIQYFDMPPVAFFKHCVEYKKKINSFICESGKISIFSDKYIWDEFNPMEGRFYEIKIKKGKYSLFSINIGTGLKKEFENSDIIGAVLVSE
jgi:hypothetical protein